jgi:hypothetical protein
MAYIEVWDETKPAGTRDANLGDDDIREFKRAIRERLAAGGVNFPSTDDADAGLHNYTKFIEQSGNPSSEANRAYLFTKDVSAVTELYWMDSAGTVVQLTTAGKILLTTLGGWVARGDMIRGSASGWERVVLGASGKVWKSDGTDAGWGDVNFQTAASQAEMEAASSLTVPVTPGILSYHPGAAKAWCLFNGGTAGTNAPTVGHNVASVTKNSTGDYTINLTVPFSSANFVVVGMANTANFVQISALAAGTIRVLTYDYNGTQVDGNPICICAYGDQ